MQDRPGLSLDCLPPSKLHRQRLIIPATMYDSYRVSATRDVTKPWCPGFYWWLSTQARRASMPQPNLSVFIPASIQTGTVWPKASIINHIVSLNYLAWPEAPNKQTLSIDRIFKVFRGHLPGAGQGPVSLEQGLNTPNLLNQPFTTSITSFSR